MTNQFSEGIEYLTGTNLSTKKDAENMVPVDTAKSVMNWRDTGELQHAMVLQENSVDVGHYIV
jgi:hypothetical protein